MKENLTRKVALAQGVVAELAGSVLKVKGPAGEVARTFIHPRVKLTVEKDQIVLQAAKATKREKTMLGSFQAHIRNMIKGAQEPFVYNLKICSGHFPMSVSVSGKEFVVKNFLGENTPRKAAIAPGVEVKVEGAEIIVKSPDKEIAGLMAARIEQLCRITNRDRRIFQDGCYITSKAGKKM